jgi:hypothetical protein
MALSKSGDVASDDEPVDDTDCHDAGRLSGAVFGTGSIDAGALLLVVVRTSAGGRCGVDFVCFSAGIEAEAGTAVESELKGSAMGVLLVGESDGSCSRSYDVVIGGITNGVESSFSTGGAGSAGTGNAGGGDDAGQKFS